MTMITMRTRDPPVRRLSSPEFPASSQAARRAAIGANVMSFFMPASFKRQSLPVGIPEGSARKLIGGKVVLGSGLPGRNHRRWSNVADRRTRLTMSGPAAGLGLVENEAMER
jgi:hypothetical protein